MKLLKSCTIVYGLFYGNIQCTRILGTLWCMHRQCVPSPLFGPGDEASISYATGCIQNPGTLYISPTYVSVWLTSSHHTHNKSI